MGALPHLWLPTRPHPIESIRDITGAEKTIKKPAAFKKLVEIASYITTLLIPQEKDSALNISNKYFSKYKMCNLDWFSQTWSQFTIKYSNRAVTYFNKTIISA